MALSDDHKPYLNSELSRINKSNHSVINERIDGALALSRALGDYNYKNNKNIPPE